MTSKPAAKSTLKTLSLNKETLRNLSMRTGLRTGFVGPGFSDDCGGKVYVPGASAATGPGCASAGCAKSQGGKGI